jgi:hypothetical protein
VDVEATRANEILSPVCLSTTLVLAFSAQQGTGRAVVQMANKNKGRPNQYDLPNNHRGIEPFAVIGLSWYLQLGKTAAG